MPPEQLVDVPVPLVHERSSYDQETRLLLESLHRRREALEAARLVPVAEEQMDEEVEEGRGGGLAVPSSLPSSSLVLVRACRQHLPSWVELHFCTP